MMYRVFGFGLNWDPLPHLSPHMVVMFILTNAISIVKKDFFYFLFFLFRYFKTFFSFNFVEKELLLNLVVFFIVYIGVLQISKCY